MSIIIVGGGMVGATLALTLSSLAQGKAQIALVEAMPPDNDRHPGFDARAIALAQGTCQQLTRIGIWQALQRYATAITHVHVSDRGHAGCVNLLAQDYCLDALGHVIELHDAGRCLFELLAKAPGVTLHCPETVIDVLRTDKYAEVLLESGKRLRGQLLVAADGSDSALARACQIKGQRNDYLQYAVIANITTALLPQGRAFERFTRFGPLALLPMSQGRSSLVWCHHKQHYERINSWDDAHFLYELQSAFGWRLGQVRKVGERHCYPLSLFKADQHISHRLALIGNAVQTLHPIAGQGFNLGLRDVMSLAEILADAVRNNQDVGAYPLLNQYQQRRKADQQKTIGLTDGLVGLFSNDISPLVVGRNLGLMAMEYLPMVRNWVAKQTLGWTEY